MKIQDSSEKIIPAFEARRQFGRLLHAVSVNGETFVVKKNNEKIAAIIPMKKYNQLEKSRETFFTLMDKAQSNAKLSPEEAEKLAQEAVKAVRSSRNS